MAENRVDEISLSWPGAGLGLVWDWRPGAGTGCWGPPECWVWVLGAKAEGWDWGWDWGWRPGLGLAHSVKCKHEDLDLILRTYIRQAGHNGAQL